MSKPTIDEILTVKPAARPRIYAYSIADDAHNGLFKVGHARRWVFVPSLRLATLALRNTIPSTEVKR